MKETKFMVVDEKDNIISYRTRNEMFNKEIIARVSALWVNNSKGEFLLARRAYGKKLNPGMWGASVAGTVEESETYKKNIIKEAKEELGIDLKKLTKGPKLRTKQGDDNHFVQWYLVIIDKEISEFNVQKEEVAEIKWFTKESFMREFESKPNEFIPRMKEYMELFVK